MLADLATTDSCWVEFLTSAKLKHVDKKMSAQPRPGEIQRELSLPVKTQENLQAMKLYMLMFFTHVWAHESSHQRSGLGKHARICHDRASSPVRGQIRFSCTSLRFLSGKIGWPSPDVLLMSPADERHLVIPCTLIQSEEAPACRRFSKKCIYEI